MSNSLLYKVKSRLQSIFLPKHQTQVEHLSTFGNFYYSQEGEDAILNRLFGGKTEGFYVDVGAHHPMRFSNTYFFYKKGWKGINIDAMPGAMKIFDIDRPRDTNLEVAISSKKEELLFYIFNEPALNTFSKTEANKKDGFQEYRIIEKKTIATQTLNEVFEKYLPKNQVIDFMSVDVEGLDLEVLKSNNWEQFRPKILLVEDLVKQPLIQFIESSELFLFLKGKHYELIGKTFNTLFFKDTRCKNL